MAGGCSTTFATIYPAEVGKLAFLTGDTISPDAQAFLRATNRPYLEKPIKPPSSGLFVIEAGQQGRVTRHEPGVIVS